MSSVRVYVDGIGLYGPGMNGWAHARSVLSGSSPLNLAPIQLPAADALPPAERRRVGLSIKLSMATGFDALKNSGQNPGTLATVFSSTGGDCDNCHNILETLASSDRAVSPTRFHNSVHNAPAGYWSIANSCMAPSTSLCGYDATFAAALLEAAVQTSATGRPCLFIAFDTPYPEPLNSVRPIAFSLGVSMVLNSVRTAFTTASLEIKMTNLEADKIKEPEWESLRRSIPAARSLPLMQALAADKSAEVVIEYLDGLGMRVVVEP